MQGADECAKMLCVTMAERTALGLHTIGACDISKKERQQLAKELKRERDRTRDEQKRKSAGAKSRESYEADSLSASKPWEAMNMSRRTWYRKGKPVRGTGPSRVVYTEIGEALVPTDQKAPQAVPPLPFADIEKDGSEAVRAGTAKHRPSGPPLGAASGSTVPPMPMLKTEHRKAS